MNSTPIWLEDCRLLALLVVASAGGIVAAAQVMEHAFGHAPCPLCLMQRLWFMGAGLLALGGLAHSPLRGFWPLLSGLAAVAGAGFALRQLWLQGLPADQVPACTPPIDFMIQGGYAGLDILRAMTSGTGDCAKVGWRFLGLTFAGWALVGFVMLIALNVLQLRGILRRWS